MNQKPLADSQRFVIETYFIKYNLTTLTESGNYNIYKWIRHQFQLKNGIATTPKRLIFIFVAASAVMENISLQPKIFMNF
jgi:hypothetical protein